MTTENNFLITYGIHNFVSYARRGGQHTFIIQGAESQKMIHHAKSLIQGSYGPSVNIQVT
jgi:hypothetical protein